jgi:hypothetical protein
LIKLLENGAPLSEISSAVASLIQRPEIDTEMFLDALGPEFIVEGLFPFVEMLQMFHPAKVL